MSKTVGELLENLRNGLLHPHAVEAKVVRLEGGYYKPDSVSKAIDYLEILMNLREKANPLEKIAIEVLLQSIGHEWSKK